MGEALMGHGFFQMAQMRFGVNTQNLLAGAARGGLAHERLKALVLQNPLDHPHAVGALRVAGAHIMVQTIAVGEDERVQVDVLPWFLQVRPEAAVSSLIVRPLKDGFALCQLCRRLSFL
jgi:hypothetical protein